MVYTSIETSSNSCTCIVWHASTTLYQMYKYAYHMGEMDLLCVRNKIVNFNNQHNFSLKRLEFSIPNVDHILNLQTK